MDVSGLTWGTRHGGVGSGHLGSLSHASDAGHVDGSFAVPSSRTTGTRTGEFDVVPHGWDGAVPDGTTRIQAPTPHVWIIGRTRPTDRQAIKSGPRTYCWRRIRVGELVIGHIGLLVGGGANSGTMESRST